MPHITTATSHTFHIPVMGTGYTIDTPLKVARYGIRSVVSLMDDQLMEDMRRHHCNRLQRNFTPIASHDHDGRARRITAYLNLLHDLIDEQMSDLAGQDFGCNSDLDRCFTMLPEGSLRQQYLQCLSLPAGDQRQAAEGALRAALAPGTIDVNIMTKVDRQRWVDGAPVAAEDSDAQASLRGYAMSKLNSSLVLSAGMNPRLFAAIASYDDFIADDQGRSRKRLILKVSDFRSGMIQGTKLARLGLWIDEFRIESGLNCGGHAFAAKGLLMGPVLAEFRDRRGELLEQLHKHYHASRQASGLSCPTMTQTVTAQGGIGTAAEAAFLQDYYQLAATGWGTPFLLVPEVVNIDQEHVALLCAADQHSVYLSEASPLGLPFWNLRDSASDRARETRIAAGRPGVTCVKRHLAFAANPQQEADGTPLDQICTASHHYQQHQLAELAAGNASSAHQQRARASILAKTCLCMDLAATTHQVTQPPRPGTSAITAGPNVVNFKHEVSLSEMVDHIYGRCDLIANEDRPHLFLREWELSLDVLRQHIQDQAIDYGDHREQTLIETRDRLSSGLDHYQGEVLPALLRWTQSPEQQAAIEQRWTTHCQQLKELLEQLPLPAKV